MKRSSSTQHRTRAFSLVEVVLAIFILGIGLIMVTTIFPVGGNWTRQATESNVGQVVAQNALAIIQAHFPSGNATAAGSLLAQANTANPAGSLVAFPGLATATPVIPVSEMCYKFGGDQPYPVQSPDTATYFWTALLRLTPGVANAAGSTAHKYDVYILVFKKGTVDQTFPDPASMPPGMTDIPGTREAFSASHQFQPAVAFTNQNNGAYNGATGRFDNAVPGIGEYGIGRVSGTVFMQIVSFTTSPPRSTPAPGLILSDSGTEGIIVGVPAVGTATSPLVYVYQTTLTR